MKNKFFNLLIDLQITPVILVMFLIIITSLLIWFYLTIRDHLNEIIEDKITKNHTLDEDKANNKLFIKDELMSFTETMILIACVFYVGYTCTIYNEYLHNNLTTNTYKVAQISYDNQNVTTKDNKTIKKPSKKIYIINEPTNDPNKIGKSYYVIKTYTPEKIAKILNQMEQFTNSPKTSLKYQTRLEQHVYVKPYKNINK